MRRIEWGKQPQRWLWFWRYRSLDVVPGWERIRSEGILFEDIVARQMTKNVAQRYLAAIERDVGGLVAGTYALGGVRQQRLARRHPASEPQMSQAPCGERMPYHAPHPHFSVSWSVS